MQSKECRSLSAGFGADHHGPGQYKPISVQWPQEDCRKAGSVQLPHVSTIGS